MGGAKQNLNQSNHNSGDCGAAARVYWRVEGSLLELTTVRPIAFFTWNGQTFIERWMRRGLVLVMAVLRPFLYATNRVFATRVVHTVLRGISRDRLDLLGEEYFQYKLKPQLKAAGVKELRGLIDSGAEVVLVSQGLDHVMGPLARHLGVKWVIANRLEFRDGMATGRLLDPVIRPRGVFARITGVGPDGTRAPEQLVRDLGLDVSGLPGVDALESAVTPAVAAPAGAGASDRALPWRVTGRAAFGSRDAGREADHADRRDWVHREGLAGEPADGSAGNRADLFADPEAEIESGRRAV